MKLVLVHLRLDDKMDVDPQLNDPAHLVFCAGARDYHSLIACPPLSRLLLFLKTTVAYMGRYGKIEWTLKRLKAPEKLSRWMVARLGLDGKMDVDPYPPPPPPLATTTHVASDTNDRTDSHVTNDNLRRLDTKLTQVTHVT